ncbi:MAG: hypothetical protein LBT89_07880, partial [Planctomycetaceae bacterium]|nr:hypothetical protein [Planctomycetaceae bacterium]
RAEENPDAVLSRHLQIHFLRLGNMLKNNGLGIESLCPALRSWMNRCAFGSTLEENKMELLLQDSPLIKEAYEEYLRFSAVPELREQARERQRFINDLRLNRGEALVEGRAEGRVEEKIESARNALQRGISVDDVMYITGLSRGEIEKLQHSAPQPIQ